MNPLRRLRSLFRRRQLETEMAEEMRFHLEQRAADFTGDGLSTAEARYAAQRKFGNVGSLQEQGRDARGWGWLDRTLKDFRLALRQLTGSPGFTVLAIVTLALGIGANTAMFTVFNSLMFKPLPYANSAQLDRIDRVTAQNPEGRISPADYLDLQRSVQGYGDVTAYAVADTSLSAPGQPAEMARTGRISANFFSLLGVRLQLGRDFRPGEDVPGNDRVLILSQRSWQNRFGGRADIIGRTLRVNGEPHEIIGVLPASFNDWRHLGGLDLFIPLALSQAQATDRRSPSLRLIGRRDAQLVPTDTAGFIANFGARLARDFPDVNTGSTWRTVSLNSTVAGDNGGIMLPLLIGLSGFVLLIACSNLANLLLARTIARAREFAVRSALGASRLQLLRPLVAESLLLSLAGGACAILVARWGMDYLSYRSTADNGERALFEFDWHVLGWALGASVVTALAFSLAPALFALRLDLNHTLKSGGRGTTGGRGHQSFRRLLIVGQFAMAMILLTVATLFIRGLDELNHRRAGWSSENLITGTVVLPTAGYPDADRISGFHRLAIERLEALPGVASASISTFTPFFNWPEVRSYIIGGHELPPKGLEPAAVVNRVSPHYFDTVGTHVLAGRTFTDRDTATSTRVVIISDSAAKSLFGGENPLGQRLAQAGSSVPQWSEVVGVVADVVSVLPDLAPVTNQFYQPMAQEPGAQNEISVRLTGAPTPAIADRIRSTLTGLDPDLPVRNLQTADATINRANYQLAVLRDILSSFAVLGLALASLGIYGVIARTMAQRTNEFAIRLALGASIRDITRLVLSSGVKLALVGAGLGLIGALGVSKLFVAGFPAIHSPRLPVLIGSTVVLIAVALLACWLPARRAGKVDAISALRAE